MGAHKDFAIADGALQFCMAVREANDADDLSDNSTASFLSLWNKTDLDSYRYSSASDVDGLAELFEDMFSDGIDASGMVAAGSKPSILAAAVAFHKAFDRYV